MSKKAHAETRDNQAFRLAKSFYAMKRGTDDRTWEMLCHAEHAVLRFHNSIVPIVQSLVALVQNLPEEGGAS